MPSDGTKNLVPQNKRTKEEQKKIAQKGGKASAAARRERKKLKDELLLLLEQGDTQEMICLALIQQARRGNIKAAEFIRDTIGEKPAEKLNAQTRLDMGPVTVAFEGDLDAWSK